MLPQVTAEQLSKLSCSPREVDSPHMSNITCIDIDSTESRYMLVSSADARLSLYDLDDTGSVGKGGRIEQISKGLWGRGHQFAVTCAQWYPIDTGLFVTGGMDGNVLVWDTNTLQVATTFALGSFVGRGGVHAIHMSPKHQAHQLIACGSEENHVRLCDPRSGGTSHLLMGHRDPVLTLKWSPQCEFTLASGSADRTVRVWDIRRAGHMAVLDQHNDLEPRAAGEHRVARKRDRDRMEQISSHGGSIVQLLYSPDGQTLLSAGTDKRLRLWSATSFKNLLINFAPPGGAGGRSLRFKKGCRLAWHRDGGVIFCPLGPRVQTFRARTGEPTKDLGAAHAVDVTCVAAHPTLPHLYSGDESGTVVEWRPASKGDDSHGDGGGGDDGEQWSDDENAAGGDRGERREPGFDRDIGEINFVF